MDKLLSATRQEEEILGDLKAVCASSGYAHVIAFFCFRDNFIKYNEEVSTEELSHLYSDTFLVRTEISTLIGFMVQNDIDFTLPSPIKFQEYIEKTESLLNELHHSLMVPFRQSIENVIENSEVFKPFTSGEMLREPIFYGGESAFNFQYRDLSSKKYCHDKKWFIENKGFSVEQAQDVIKAIAKFQNLSTMAVVESIRSKNPSDWTILPGFTFTVKDISSFLDFDNEIVKAVINAFSLPPDNKNERFLKLNDFNVANAYPIIKKSTTEYLLYQVYSLTESLYDSPFYWFINDESYKNIAMTNRGDFTEKFSADRLCSIFNQNRVFRNVFILDSHKNRAGEIDVLVAFANRAIILQAKSKKLTIDARKGNDQFIKNDFKKSVQDSYDQGLSCAKLLNNRNYLIRDLNGKEIKIEREFKEIYIFCVVSDHYPALSFQARQFLKYETTEIIKPPFIMDVFYLDVIAEMLDSPLYFLSYVNRRAQYSERINSMNELTILSYHLKRNLWLGDEYDFIHLDDSIAADLDVAVLTRREGLPGKATPDGILTQNKDTVVAKIIKEIENYENPGTIDLGFFLLMLSGDTIKTIDKGIKQIAKLSKKDQDNHDFTLVFDKEKNGLTIHCNYAPKHIASPHLLNHCERRKYVHHAQEWFGLCINPSDHSVRFGVELSHEWKYSQKMEEIVKKMPKMSKDFNFNQMVRKRKKIGRNDPCPCGSGKKYKKCCMK